MCGYLKIIHVLKSASQQGPYRHLKHAILYPRALSVINPYIKNEATEYRKIKRTKLYVFKKGRRIVCIHGAKMVVVYTDILSLISSQDIIRKLRARLLNCCFPKW